MYSQLNHAMNFQVKYRSRNTEENLENNIKYFSIDLDVRKITTLNR